MANLQGYTIGAVGNMLNHYTRHQGDPQQEKYRYGNQKIDSARTHLNYSLFERDDPGTFVRQRIALADTKPSKTTNVLSDWVITLPKNERLAGREREFFAEVYNFLAEKVGQENIVGAWVHVDETSPHMHFSFVPLTEQAAMTNDKSHPLRWTERDEKKNPEHKAGEVKRDKKGTVRYKRVVATDENGNPIIKRTISQSKIFNRSAMQRFHPELSTRMKQHFGFDVGVELADEGDKVLSRLGHEDYIAAKTTLKKIAKDVKRLADEREEIRHLTSQESERLEQLRKAGNDARQRAEIMEAIVAECSAADDAPISRKSMFFDRIASICARIMERIGGVARKSARAIKGQLNIGVRYGGASAAGLHDYKAIGRGAGVHPIHIQQQQQMEKGFSL